MESSIELKKTVLALIACVLLGLILTACNHQAAASFTGTYVNSAQSEFSIADDTLVIEPGADEQVLIHRKTGYNVINEQGKLGRRQYETEEWKAVYDPQKRVLTETRKGLVISLQNGELLLENRRYRRTN